MKTLSLALACSAIAFGALPELNAAPVPVSVALGSYGPFLQAPVRVAADAAGNAYVVDTEAGRITLFDAWGRMVGQRDGFARPLGIAVDAADRIFVGEQDSGSVSVFDVQWNRLYQLGAGAGEFQFPNHIGVDPVNNTIYVSDSSANAIKVYAGATRINQFGAAGTGNGQFDFPAGISVRTNGEVFVMDQNNDRVQVFDLNGAWKRTKKFGGMLGPSGRKQGVLVDNAGRLYVVDTFQGNIKAYDASTGTLLATVGSFGQLSGQLNSPAGLALDSFNRLHVTSANNNRIELYGLDSYLHLTSTPAANTIATGSDLILNALAGGSGPFSYQWSKDGGALTGATNATLVVAGLTAGDAGGYSVVVTGPTGAITSSVAAFAVMDPPAIISDPRSQTVPCGASVELSVSAAGSSLSYQWKYYGRDLEGATNSVLSLPDVQFTDAGIYSVEVRNAVGVASSATAVLDVKDPAALLEESLWRGTIIIFR